ncbi:transmembrane protein, putative [Medicago truncatula]|uniref:Transmembrane protein, putative n=1 Tax=Medicago truncatula TaxID=3880 RepID=G7KWX8_MEDTR|nr:transmembrane protein, putative [Medicago truncatula]
MLCFSDLLPTKDNLACCGNFQADSLLCSCGCGMEESDNHLFLHCHFYGNVWYSILHSLGISTVLPTFASSKSQSRVKKKRGIYEVEATAARAHALVVIVDLPVTIASLMAWWHIALQCMTREEEEE